MSKTKILIVEDEWSARETLKQRLEFEGYEVYTAVDGEEALSKFSELGSVDVILLDIMMPKVNGYQFCRKIKDQDSTKNTPIIFVSAKSQESDKFWAKKTGADGFIGKPYDIKELLKMIKEFESQKIKV